MAVCRMKSWICWTPRLPSFSCTCSSLELKYWITWKGNIYYKTVFSYCVTPWLTQPPLLRCSAFLNFDLILCLVPLLFRQKNFFWGAAIAQWIHLRLPSCRPGFDSQALHLCFYHLLWNSYYICTCVVKKIENKPKRGRVRSIFKKNFFCHCRPYPVWPDVEIKSSTIFLIAAQKETAEVLN